MENGLNISLCGDCWLLLDRLIDRFGEFGPRELPFLLNAAVADSVFSKYLPFETFTNKNEILILAEENIVSFPTTFLSICTKHSVTMRFKAQPESSWIFMSS